MLEAGSGGLRQWQIGARRPVNFRTPVPTDLPPPTRERAVDVRPSAGAAGRPSGHRTSGRRSPPTRLRGGEQ
eukprot:3924867-Alexandrium_andersonii.AAC.2